MTPACGSLDSQPGLADAACTVCLVSGVPCCSATNLPLAASPSRSPAQAGQITRQGEAAAISRLTGCGEQVSAESAAGSSSQEAALALALEAASVSAGDVGGANNGGQGTCCTSGASPERAAAAGRGIGRHCAAALCAQVQDLRIRVILPYPTQLTFASTVLVALSIPWQERVQVAHGRPRSSSHSTQVHAAWLSLGTF